MIFCVGPDGSPIDIAVTTLPNKEALVLWKPPNLFEQNGKITKYKVAVEIEDSLGQWVLAQAEIGTVAPQTNATVKNLFSGRKYRIRVSAATAIGFGPLSDPYDFTTPEDGKKSKYLISNDFSAFAICSQFPMSHQQTFLWLAPQKAAYGFLGKRYLVVVATVFFATTSSRTSLRRAAKWRKQ